MIKQLRRRFILLSMLALFLVLLTVLALVNIVNIVNMNRRADEIIDILAQNEGRFPSGEILEKKEEKAPPNNGISPETPYETRYFIVRTDTEKEIGSIDTGHVISVTAKDAAVFAQDVLNRRSMRGYIDNYRYGRISREDGYLLIFVDTRVMLTSTRTFLYSSLLFFSGVMITLFLLLTFLSGRVIKPFAENIQKQKHFITDAGHELRTPLAIISADNEVLEMTSGKNEWTLSVRHQIRHMSKLIDDLILLAKMDEADQKKEFAQIPLSALALEKVGNYKAPLELKQIQISSDIVPDIRCRGEEKNLSRLFDLLFDNAIKYTNNRGEIGVSLRKEGKKIRFTIENTCDTVPAGDLNRLFDRFYRADASRAKEQESTGGYGLGLSIAQAIVLRHDGRIYAEVRKYGSIAFIVELPI